ncbi:MAG: CHRD domain-containing protein [Segetibacter sp.]
MLFPVYHSSATAGTVHAMALVTAVQASEILLGGSYVNIHTSNYPAGEIRAQLLNNTGVRYFAGELAGSNEVPANTSTARGTVIVVYNTETNVLILAGDYQHLSDTVTAAHIHPGGPGVVNPPIIPLITTPRDSTGSIIDTAELTEAQETDLLAGNMYVNVHSKAFPNGEIRTQLVPTTSGETHSFLVNLTEAQVRPNSTGTANGNALIIVDKTTGLTYVTGFFQGINSNVTGAHIHGGPVGVSGPAILPLNIVQRIAVPHSGTVSGSGTLSPSAVDSMINGLTYIDIHSSFFTNNQPAIRAQLGDLVLPVKLTYLNASKQKK